jgi:hypothetical protein
MKKRGRQELSASTFLATNARRVVAVSIQVGKNGAMLFVSRFLATNARMGVVVAVAIQVGKNGVRPFVLGV